MPRSQLLKLYKPSQNPDNVPFLPSPTAIYERTLFYGGAVHELANWSVGFDKVSEAKYQWRLGWDREDNDARATISQKLADQMEEGYMKFRDVDGTVYNVLILPEIREDAPLGYNPIRWGFSITLRQL